MSFNRNLFNIFCDLKVKQGLCSSFFTAKYFHPVMGAFQADNVLHSLCFCHIVMTKLNTRLMVDYPV